VSVELRPPSLADTAGISRMSDEFHRAEGGDRISPAMAKTWLTTPSLELEHDARVALADGEIAGFADVYDASGERKLLWSELRADPTHPEALPPLLDFVEGRAQEMAVPGGRLRISVPERAVPLRELLEARSFAFKYFSFRMFAELDGNLPEPEWPPAIEARAFRPGDERVVYETHEETFSEHPDHTPISFENWKHWALAAPKVWTLALSGDEVQGISLCRREWGGDPRLGWISVLGVRRPWRGRGLGLALLRHSFRQLRDRGNQRVGLGVEAENAAALRLYERAGMQVEQQRLLYEKLAR
jgi:mycothiol synthase